MKNFIITFVKVLAIIGIGIEVIGPFVNERTNSYIIKDIVKVKNGFFTNIYPLIYTDQGVLSVHMRGFNAHPEVINKLHVSDTVTLGVRGLYFPYLQMYPNIIKVVE